MYIFGRFKVFRHPQNNSKRYRGCHLDIGIGNYL